MKAKERSFFEISKRFLEPLFKEKLITSKAIFMYFIWAIPLVYHIFFIQKIVFYIENHDKNGFIKVIIIYGIVNVLYEIISYFVRNWGWVITVNAYRKIIHREYLQKFISLGNTETEKLGTGKLISIMDKGIDIWSLLLNNLIESSLTIILAFVYSFYTVFNVNYFYGIIFLVVYIILHILLGYINNFIIKYRRERTEHWQTYISWLVKMIMSKFEILQTGKTLKEIDRLDQVADLLSEANYKMSKTVHIFYRLPKSFIIFSKFFILLYLGFQILDGKSNFSTFVGVFGIFTVLDFAINNSVTFFKDFTNQFSFIEKLWDFFDETPEIQGYETGKDFIYKSGKIELQNITFGYEENKKVFNKFDLDIIGGKITAFVGNSGGGKTTLVKIISSYIKKDSGKVIVDGQDLDEISLKSYYKNIGYLTQEPSVFDGTILENLTYALEETPPARSSLPPQVRGIEGEQKIDEIIKLSKCDFIYDFPKGLETEIGERGIRLSGGQKQRLAIAKIMLKNPKIIILDEPTSALDSFSEELITKAMNNLFAGRTVLVIAHRLQTVKHADEIIVIESGKIAERGKHSELIHKKGIYNRMLELQSGF